MKKVELALTPAQAADPLEVRQAALRKANMVDRPETTVITVRRSLDARKQPLVRLQLEVHARPPAPPRPILEGVPNRLRGRVIVVGAGPAGYFAALELLLCGLRPIILERGKDARARRYDLRAIMQDGVVNENSNYCFGEGGAGTYSDGKLYTRSDKRGNVSRVLQLLVEHGARPEILADAHPHIGSNKLPGVVERLRESILRLGGEVHFNCAMTDLVLQDGRVVALLAGGKEWRGDAYLLATGHSARDVYRLLARKGLALEPKTFAMGVRIEHPQPLIDQVQYRQNPRDPYLPPSSYRLVASCGVWSFCMCPGGLIVPAATAPGEVVINGMSMSGRNSRWANSGMVAEILPEDLEPFAHHGVLAGLEFQSSLEQRAFAANGEGSQKAPAQRLVDFLQGRNSSDLPRCSYVPGLALAPLQEVLTPRLNGALAEGLREFIAKMPLYGSEEAVLVGVETRTSAPLRIPREEPSLAHPQAENLYPCAEGAGYAGGIVSAALDGQRVARVIAERSAAV